MTRSRRGSLIAATWLIGLGLVFLIKQAANLSWSEAWPMFVILAGVGGLVSTAVRGDMGLAGIWAFTWPIAWLVIGAILLLSTTGNLASGPGELVSDYWPLALVVLGVWFLIGAVVPRSGAAEALVLPIGSATEANVRIQYGAGELTTHAAAIGHLVDGQFLGGVAHRQDGPGRVELRQDMANGWPWFDRRYAWDVGLTPELPLDLRVDGGATRMVLDLRDLKVRSLELHTGASGTRVLLPRAAGATTVRAESGAAELVFEVPIGVAARIRSRMVLGSTQIDQGRFPPTAVGYESLDYASAQNRIDIDVQGGVGSLKVVSAA
ncbi:MAG: hypothetical protein ACXWXA_08410 [Candidatus Limnocylindrales bacterium]